MPFASLRARLRPRRSPAPPAAGVRALLAALLLATSATACGQLGDVVAPGRPASERAPARVALAARLPATVAGAQDAPFRLGVQALYERADGTLVPLGVSQLLTLSDAATQQVPLALDLAPCLGDPQRRGAATNAPCRVRLELTLLLGERVLDRSTVPDLDLQPGASVAVPGTVQLFEVADLRLSADGQAPTPGGTLRLEIGQTLPLAAAVVDAAGQPVAGRPVAWTSDAPAVARVDPLTGAVSGVGVGRARVSATAGGRSATMDVRVVPAPQRVTVAPASEGSGSGRVVSVPAGIDCRVAPGRADGACAADFPADGEVALVATPDARSLPGAWADACAAAAPDAPCRLTPAEPRSVRVGFVALRRFGVTADAFGDGVVTSTPAGIDCVVADGVASGRCVADFRDGTAVTLAAAGRAGSVFSGWSGDCEGLACTLVLLADRGVGARFSPPAPLTVSIGGSGGGRVAGGTIACTRTGAGTAAGPCAATLPFGTAVVLTATPDSASTFAGWSGPCLATDGATCTVRVERAQAITATFARRQVTLTLALAGAGAGTLAVDGIVVCTLRAGEGSAACPAQRLDVFTTVTVSAAPAPGSFVTGITGACRTTGAPSCAIRLTEDASVGVGLGLTTFELNAVVDANSTGGGALTVGGSAGCTATPGTPCRVVVPQGARVTFTAMPAAGAQLLGWGGACLGVTTPTCAVTVAGATTVSARFAARPVLRVASAPSVGGGRVVSTPAGIDCTFPNATGGSRAGTCTATFDVGTAVTLAATPDSASAVGTWGGACAGASGATCRLTLVDGPAVPREVLHAFAAATAPLTLTLGGSGTGTLLVDGAPACTLAAGAGSTTCTVDRARFTPVTLSVALTGGARLGCWRTPRASALGATCTLTVGGPTTAGVALVARAAVAVAAPAGGATGGGTVTWADGAPACTLTGAAAGAGCTRVLDVGQTVVLGAAPAAGSVFLGWQGACAAAPGAGCTLTVPAGGATAVARFAAAGTLALAFDAATSGDAALHVATPALECAWSAGTATGNGCAPVALAAGTPLTVTAVPGPTAGFVGWTAGPCVGQPSATCVVTLPTGATVVRARFGALVPIALEITREGEGDGAVTIASIGRSQTVASGAPGSTRLVTTTYPTGATLTVTATPAAGSVFAGWSDGACATALNVNGPADPVCRLVGFTLTGGANSLGRAAFQLPAAVVRVFGDGVGTIVHYTSLRPTTPATCSFDTADQGAPPCAIPTPIGSRVQLLATALPPQAHERTAWGGACAGQGGNICTFTWTGVDPTVTFAPRTSALYVISVRPGLSSVGRGAVQLTAAMRCEIDGATLGGQCDGTAGPGWTAIFNPQPAPGFQFAGWGGDCAGQGVPCQLATTRDLSVLVYFRPAPPAR